MIYGFDTECYINSGELKIIGVEGLGSFYIPSSTPIYFLFDLMKKNKMNKFCCFNLQYDAGALIKYLFPIKFYKAIHLGLNVKYNNISLRYIPKKKLTINYKGYRIYFYDTWQFYHQSLKNASKNYLNKNKLEYNILNMMPDVLEKNIIEALKYCYIDAELCGQLFRRIYAMVEKIGIKNPELLSQGYIAYQYFKNELTRVPFIPFNFKFQKAYRGGRFEVFKKGYFKKAYYYDINSAYPFAISKLKSIEGCKTVMNNFYMQNSDYSVFNCNVSIPFKEIISPIGIKVFNKIIFPTGYLKNIWIDKNDFDCLKKSGSQIEILMAYHIITYKETIFKNKINYIYKMKSKYPEDAQIWKILANSIYGKLLQNIKQYVRKTNKVFNEQIADIYFDKETGQLFFKFDNKGRCLNFIFASFITSHTRKQIYYDIFKHQKHIIAIFTDGIISDKKLPLKLSNNLGDYKLKKINNLYMIGTGIYFYNYKKEQFSLFRGFRVDGKSMLNKILKSKRSIVNFEIKEHIGLGKSIATGTEIDFNLIMPIIKQLDLNFDNKRIWMNKIKKGQDLQKQISSLSIPII